MRHQVDCFVDLKSNSIYGSNSSESNYWKQREGLNPLYALGFRSEGLNGNKKSDFAIESSRQKALTRW